MKKRKPRLLALTLALTLLLPLLSAPAAAQCGNGGFYVGANAGAAWTKTNIAKSQSGTAILSLLQTVVHGVLDAPDATYKTKYAIGGTMLPGINAGNWIFYVPIKDKKSKLESRVLKITNWIENDQGGGGTFAYGPMTEGNGLTDIGRDFIRNALDNTALDDLADQTLCGEYARQAATEALGLSETTLSWEQLLQQVDNLLSTLNTVDDVDAADTVLPTISANMNVNVSGEVDIESSRTIPDRIDFDFDSAKVSSAAAYRSMLQALQVLHDKIAPYSAVSIGDHTDCLTMAELQTLTRATGIAKTMGAAMGFETVSETGGTGGTQALTCEICRTDPTEYSDYPECQSCW